MKLCKTFVFSTLALLLFGCSSSSTDDALALEQWRHSFGAGGDLYGLNPDGNTIITKEKTVELIDPSVVHVAKTKGDYLEAMTRQFRKDLISSGSQIKQQDSKIYMRIPAQSVFGTNQATIKSSFEKVMKSIAENLKKYPETMIRIIGHTDNSDSVLNSKTLSLRQANAFSNYLRVQGVEADRLLAEGKGSLDPIANNATKEGRAQNCYLEVIIYNLQ